MTKKFSKWKILLVGNIHIYWYGKNPSIVRKEAIQCGHKVQRIKFIRNLSK